MRTESIRTVIGETCLDATVEVGFASRIGDLVAEARYEVETKIGEDPFFGSTFSPYQVSASDTPVVRRMCEASVSASVGPMAAVAGAIAAHVAESLIEEGCRYGVIDNGGDIALFSPEPVVIRILPDPGGEPVGMLVESESPVGVCSSSGTNGHSVSLGESDVCTVVSSDPALADACATLLGNMVRRDGGLGNAVEAVCSIAGVDGCLACIGGETAMCGDFPPLIPLVQRGQKPSFELG